MQSGKRLSQLAVAGVAVAALVTGCGSSSGGSVSGTGKPSTGAKISTDSVTPQALLASSVDKTLAAKNADIALSFKGGAEGKEIGFSGTGVIDFVGQKLQMTLNLPAESGLSGTIEERLVDKVLYLKLPAAASAATGGKPWVKVDTSKLGTSGSSLGSLNQNPADILGSLRSVSSGVTTVGTEDIRGVKTTHYRANIDLAKAAAVGGAKQGLDAATIEEYKKVLGSNSLPADVYLDSKGLPARFTITVKPAAGTTGAADVESVSVSIDFFNYGKADTASIVAPPASDIGSLPTGAGSLTG
jgi:hypothetical protein